MIGETIDGRYRIIEPLARGGMGTVFLAEHLMIRRRVAIKVLHPEFAADERMVRRFMNEARAAGTLGHPNIVESTDMGYVRQLPFIVYEYVEGVSLGEDIARLGGLPVRRALKIATQIASALDAAHAAGIVHLDLKCDNVLLTDKNGLVDHVKVLDFGIAQFLGAEVETTKGFVMGTPEFMAPEQIADAERVDKRADIYSLGVVLYEMLTARRPFGGQDARALLHRIVHEPPAPLAHPGVSVDLDQLILDRLLAKHPARRFQSMKDVQLALEAFSDPLRPRGTIPPPMVRMPVLPKIAEPLPRSRTEVTSAPRRWPIGLIVLMLVAGLAGGALEGMSRWMEVAARRDAAAALAMRAGEIADALFARARDAQTRARGIARTPMLRAAIETDAATLDDMARTESLFVPIDGEVLEVFQLHEGAPVSLIRLPAGALPLEPTESVQVARRGSSVVLQVSAPIERPTSGVGGVIVLATLLDGALMERKAGDAWGQTLLGLDQAVRLGTGRPASGTEITAPITVDPALDHLTLSLAAVIPDDPERAELRLVRDGLWILAGGLLVLVVAVRVRRSRR